MKILIVTDKQGTAIDRLAHSVKRNLPHHQIVVLPVHPKRNDADTLIDAQKLMQWADIIDVHYWKSGVVLREMFPKEFDAKPRILFHFNPYDAESEENKQYTIVTVGNSEIHNRVPYAYLVPYGIDLSYFKYNENYTEEKRVMMSVNRIEGKKGVVEVAKACHDLGYAFTLIGRVSKPEYIQQVFQACQGKIEFIENATEEQLRDAYYRSAVHVCNSTDGFESGTLPILEAMACGTPVLTRMVGHVPDVSDGGNMIVRAGKPEDIDDLKLNLKDLMENRELRLRIREKAWDSVRQRDDRRMALQVQKLYYKLFHPTLRTVSVIIPTKDHPESFAEALIGAVEQDYPKMEIVVADSGDTPVLPIIKAMRTKTEIPIKYIHFPHNYEYTLAKARNLAVIEADGEVLVFCDDRLKMKPNAVRAFEHVARSHSWYWGSKDGIAKGFVENFSSVMRKDLLQHGLFNERLQWYGGLTQDVRTRYEIKNNFQFFFLQEAEADVTKKSTSKSKRRDDIIEAKFTLYKLYDK